MFGRPSSYTPEKANYICEKLSEGIPLAEICREENMPHPSTVRNWARQNEALSLALADARENGEERIAADIRRIANGDPGFSTGDIYRDKLKIDTDLKLLACWNPKKYGNKQSLEVNQTVSLSALVEEAIKIKDVTPNSAPLIENQPERVETFEDLI